MIMSVHIYLICIQSEVSFRYIRQKENENADSERLRPDEYNNMV